jgi:hypothetical protein
VDDFNKYETLHKQGANPAQIYLAGKKDGLDQITLIRMLRRVSGLSLVEAKEVVIQAERLADSLTAFQETLAPAVDQALNSWNGSSPANNQQGNIQPPAVEAGEHS